MKIRIGFVSNSSSCSFVIKRRVLSDGQLQRIKDYVNCGELEKCKAKETRCLGCRDNFWQHNDHGWEIKVDAEKISCDTIIANFDLYSYITRVLEVNPRDIDVDDEQGIDVCGGQSETDYYEYKRQEAEWKARQKREMAERRAQFEKEQQSKEERK